MSQWVLPWWRFDPAIARFIVFGALFATGVILLVRLIARQLARLISWDQPGGVARLVSAVLGAGRGLWTAGILALIGLAVNSSYVTQSIEQRALSGPALAAGMRSSLDRVRAWYPGDRLAGPAVPMLPPPPEKPARRAHGAHS